MKPLILNERRAGPLETLRVLDISRLLAGNFLSHNLAEFGADVLKIEDPKVGDPLRHWNYEDVEVLWKVYARNKRSVAIDLRSDEGRKLLAPLIKHSNILIENYKPGGLEKIGYGHEKLRELNPDLVIVRISGWGQEGPYKHKPGFGTLVEAFSGFASKSGFPDSPPLLPNLGLADLITGLTGAYAVLAAIRQVEVSKGAGQVIDLNLLDCMINFLAADPAICQITGKPIPRLGNRGEMAAPRNLYKTSDGQFLALSASMQSMAERLFRAIGREDMIADEKFSTNSKRLENHEELDRIISEFIARRSLSENVEFFEQHGVTVGPLHDGLSILSDQHVHDRGVFMTASDPDAGDIPMQHTVPRLSETPGGVHALAPRLGQHTTEVLEEFGIAAEEISNLAVKGVINRGDVS